MPSWIKLLLLTGVCIAWSSASADRLANGMCRYGNMVTCCWGWTRETWGHCRPLCELGCKHGKCVGPDQCRCHQGYTGKTCNQDVNECGLKPRPCPDRCMNTLGSYKCYCLHGYMTMRDGTCKNSRTCAMTNCQYGCAVMKGEVMCQCPSPGLRLAPDRRTCVDIDECVTGQARCPRLRECVNTFGSYICRCYRGFKLRYVNGKYQCTDKNDLSICHDKPGSKCTCETVTNGKRYDCKPLIKVTIQPARPATTPKPTTKITTATTTRTTIPPTTSTTRPITTTTTAKITTTVTATTPTTIIATSTTPPTIPTTMTTTTITTSAATATLPTTVATATLPTTVATTAAPITTHTPTTLGIFTLTTKHITTTPTPITTTAINTRTTVASSAPSTGPLITSTLDNRIQDISQRPRGDVHIPRNTGENSLFDLDFDIELGNTEEYARDDPGAGSLSCSFDHGVCSWMTDIEGDLHWEAVDDPAGGRYLKVSEATTGRSIKGARLTVPLAPPLTPHWQGGDLCLSFRHLLSGHYTGSLQVFVRKGRSHSPAIWTRTGGQGWRNTDITIWGRGLESVVMKADRRQERRGQIAVDDFTLHRGACRDGSRE